MSAELVGLDIGGSHTRGVLFRDGTPVRSARSGSANVQNVPAEQAHACLHAVLSDLGAPPTTPVVVGSGGVDTPHDAARLAGLVRSAGSLAASTRVTVVHDTRLILAAGGHTIGIALIAGTGSVAWGVDASAREARAGGWGHLLGDEGSGWWIGREAVRRVLRLSQEAGAVAPGRDRAASSAGREGNELTRAVLEHAGVAEPTDLIGAFHDRPDRTHWAGLARPVCELAATGDAQAGELVAAAAEQLARLALAVAGALGQDLPVVVDGGLTATTVGGKLAELLEHHGLAVTLLDHEPVLGAPLLARSAPA
ncbi:N-acetylglucosamine kinase [Kocuria sp.]|uniref:N-acetylglucosamine kinase n=1 Tax=Kocuria sp. TaxID=1871328 RepID=UPI0026DCBCD6|nr:BadF/BadG/BcrA/BcrD ATPase family protein [Kocuria sp.]MDO4917948.1 BadF/BadG/BcrA/BcrD ATPase family protein [Kocuria sp.]